MVSNPAIPVFVFAREEDGMFRRSFSPCSLFDLCKLRRYHWRGIGTLFLKNHYRTHRDDSSGTWKQWWSIWQ